MTARSISLILIAALLASQVTGCASNRNIDPADPVELTESIDQQVVIYTKQGQWVTGRLVDVTEDHLIVVEGHDEKAVMLAEIDQLTVEGPVSVKRTLLFSGGAFAIAAVGVYLGVGYFLAYLVFSE